MSNNFRFVGTLTFADPVGLERGLDALFKPDDQIIRLHYLKLDRASLTLSVDCDCYGNDDEWNASESGLHALARHARSGEIDCAMDREWCRSIRASPSSYERSALHHHYDVHFAADSGDAAWLREIHAANPRALATSGASPMTLAAWVNSVESIEVLVGAGISPNNALTHAKPDAMRALLAAGADPNQWGVLVAACKRDDGTAEILIEAGALAKPDEYLELAHACAGTRRLALLRTFARDPAFAEKLTNWQVVDAAIAGGDSVVLDFLLEHGAKLPDKFLQKAVASGSIPLVELALREPDAIAKCGPSNDHEHAMCIAAVGGRVAVMTLLADRGVPIIPSEPGQNSPLHTVAFNGDIEALEAVLDWYVARNLPLDTLDRVGHTPFMNAFDRAAAMMAFVKRGIDPKLADRDRIAETTYEEFLELLDAAGYSIDDDEEEEEEDD